jgi:hypothetical protein
VHAFVTGLILNTLTNLGIKSGMKQRFTYGFGRAFALIVGFFVTLGAGQVMADGPRIIGATAEKTGMGWRISVTLEHGDSGWDHYADGWEVLDKAGNRLGLRKLMHPHVDEQPFTRSLVSVMVPDGERQVVIRARCSQAGWASEDYMLTLKP